MCLLFSLSAKPAPVVGALYIVPTNVTETLRSSLSQSASQTTVVAGAHRNTCAVAAQLLRKLLE